MWTFRLEVFQFARSTFAFPIPQKSARFRLNNVPLSKMGWATTGLIQQKKPTPKRRELVNGLRDSTWRSRFQKSGLSTFRQPSQDSSQFWKALLFTLVFEVFVGQYRPLDNQALIGTLHHQEAKHSKTQRTFFTLGLLRA